MGGKVNAGGGVGAEGGLGLVGSVVAGSGDGGAQHGTVVV